MTTTTPCRGRDAITRFLCERHARVEFTDLPAVLTAVDAEIAKQEEIYRDALTWQGKAKHMATRVMRAYPSGVALLGAIRAEIVVLLSGQQQTPASERVVSMDSALGRPGRFASQSGGR